MSATAPNKQLNGNIIKATPDVTPAHIQYSVVSFQFVLDTLEFSGSGDTAGRLTLARKPNGNIGETGSSRALGVWHDGGDGLGFFHADGDARRPKSLMRRWRLNSFRGAERVGLLRPSWPQALRARR